MADPASRIAELEFSEGRRATRATASAGGDVETLLAAVGLGSRSHPVIVVCGGARNFNERRLQRARTVVGRAVCQAAGSADAVVLDGGTDAGVMSVIGQARKDDPDAMPTLVGIAPRGKVSEPADGEQAGRTALEPNHSHFLLAPGDQWGDETPLLLNAAAAIAPADQIVVVLVAGGNNTRREAEEAVDRGWPVIVVKGFGGVADRFASAARWFTWRRFLRHSRVARYDRLGIVKSGRVLADSIIWEFAYRPVLRHAWRVWAAYDTRAGRLRRWFFGLQGLVILLGIALTALGLAYTDTDGTRQDAIRWATLVLPSVVAILIAWIGRRALGKRWIFLRAAAEAVKSETFRYRMGAAPYDDREAREDVLSGRLEVINKQLSGTDALSGPVSRPLRPGAPRGVGRDSISDLSAIRYVDTRLVNQLSYYQGKVREKTRRRNLLQLTALAMGGAGTVLAAVSLEPTVAITAAVSAGALSYLALRQDEPDVVTYNEAASALETAELKWLAAGTSGRDERVDTDLVTSTEKILTEEVSAWARRMARALEHYSEQQRESSKDE